MNHRPIDDEEEEAESACNGLEDGMGNHDHLLASSWPPTLGVCQGLPPRTKMTVVHQNGQCRADEDGATTPDKLASTLAPSVEGEEEEEVDESMQCGIGALRPSCLQHLANKKIFLAVFCLASVLQGIYYTYFVSVLTTIEKLFQIPSKTTGFIMSATEMGQIGGALLLTYYGGHGHRPKWIACGMLLFAVASFLCSLPHFLYGSQLSRSLNLRNHNSSFADPELCYPNVTTVPPQSSMFMSTTSSTAASDGVCLDDDPEKQNHITSIVLGIFFISLLFIGIGSTAVYTLGIPYIDDNVANRDSPMYFAITIGVRIIGPVFGFLLGSLCTMIYVNPFEEPMITNKDPRWIGAWWLGPFIVAAALVFVSSAMLAFPRRLPDQRVYIANGHVSSTVTTPSITAEPNSTGSNSVLLTHNKSPLNSISHKPSIRDFPATMRRLLKNRILLLRTASTVLHILPISGLYTFLPKYLESQFRLTATKANITSGIAGILVMGIGIFASGTFMRLFKPKPRFVAAWIALCALAFSLGMLILTFVGCPITDFKGLQKGEEPSLSRPQVEEQLITNSGVEITAPCNRTCTCGKNQMFTPVCTSEGNMYHSACYAGCRNYTMVKENSEKIYIFHDCECLTGNTTVTLGHCPLECNNFAWYVCIFSITVLIHSTSEVGSMLLTLRCVDPKDKAMALGLISFAIGLFGNVPCPIIYGVVVDSACIVWKSTCNRLGACWFYDPSKFRMTFHGMTSGIMFLAFFVDVVVWYKATCIHFSDEDLPKTGEETQPMNSYQAQFETTV